MSEFKSFYKDQAAVEAIRFLGENRLLARGHSPVGRCWLIEAHGESWNDVFRRTLGQAERSLVSELRDLRNKWAHQESFSTDDAYRAFDSAGRLLTAVSAPQADEIEKTKTELLRLRFDEQVRAEKRKSAGQVKAFVYSDERPVTLRNFYDRWHAATRTIPGAPAIVGRAKKACRRYFA